ncbi:XRE family transcriptional regulator [Methylobacterium brachythecii]|uniref:Repressor n=1 Tax=Methylobacterium brachythecii TaxID=1176177 RepID=A0A7W6APA7_9HYPH|nr:XRE family transcriptional regulator [Methylobacterium brachythecii]MBB3904231.1 phage repressor protein C with HTH and peptisase S24 domain [Methylobacterium brachythecii]GLS45107.1 repressor [Methylobacterium brachythecii]
MSKAFGAVLRQARNLKDLSQKEVADHFGIQRPAVGQWEAGSTFPGTEKLGQLGDMLGIDMDAALKGRLVMIEHREAGNGPAEGEIGAEAASVEAIEARAPIDVSRFMGPRDIPIFGTSEGGDGEGDFSLNRNAIDYAPRPPGIARRTGVYALYVRGDSVSPAYEDGARIYVDSNRAPRPRDYVVIELKADDDQPGKGYIKRLVRSSAKLLVVEQFNPAKEIEFEQRSIRLMHRVIPWDELLGL